MSEGGSVVALAKRQRNQRGEGGRLREEAIAAAMRLLDRTPAAELSLRTVAREAGVAAPSLYRQFADADTLMREIIVECWRQVADEMKAAVADLTAMQPLECVQAQMAAFVRYAMERPSRYQLLFALSVTSDQEMDGPLRPAYRAMLGAIGRHADEGGRLPLADVVSTTILTISLAHGRIALAHLAPARPGNSAIEVAAFVRNAVAELFGPCRPSSPRLTDVS